MATTTFESPPSSSSSNSIRPRRRVSETSTHLNEMVPSLSLKLKAEQQHHFPFKLYDMLEYAADSEFSSAVTWTEDGQAFSIHDKDMYMKFIVPQFFKQTKFRSFTRQLNLWGFDRLEKVGPGSRTWRHDNFIRGNIERLDSIQRTEIKSKTIKPSSQNSNRTSAKKTMRAATARAGSPEQSTDGSLSSTYETAIPVPAVSPISNPYPIIDIPQNVQFQPLVPNARMAFQPRFQPPPIWCPETASSYAIPSTDTASTYVSPDPEASTQYASQMISNNWSESNLNPVTISQPTVSQSSEYDINPVHAQQNVQQGTHEEDILYLLSGLFESEESSRDDDISSVFSFNETTEDFMNPISF